MADSPHPKLRTATTTVAKVSLLCFAAAVLAEALSAAAYYVMNSSLPYLSANEVSPAKANSSTEEETVEWLNVFHPVLGFTRPPQTAAIRLVSSDLLHRMAGTDATPQWASLTANNFGYFSSVDYPYTPVDTDEFIVVVVGGSVAHWFTLMERDYLEDRISALVGAGRRHVRVLSFAQGAHKEPQQLITLAYFLSLGQTVNVVLNIDGFNEVALSARNAELGYEPTIPSIDILLPLTADLRGPSTSTPYIRTLAAALEARDDREILRDLLDRNRSAFAYFALKTGLAITESRISENSQRVAELLAQEPPSSPILLNRLRTPVSEEPLQSTILGAADVWMRSSVAIQKLLVHFPEARYIHILQPNQYFSRKRFSAEERQYAINGTSPYARYVMTGYPELRRRIPDLRSEGVTIVDATMIFDSVPETVYVDSCCHYNELGNRILADLVVGELERVLGS